MTPREEANELHYSAIGIALKLVKEHGSHIPFAIVLERKGDRINIAADDTEIQDRDELAAAVQDQVKAMCTAGSLKAVAFARNISFRESPSGPSITGVEINLDHADDRAVTRILPYAIGSAGELYTFDLIATDSRVSFFSKSQTNTRQTEAPGPESSSPNNPSKAACLPAPRRRICRDYSSTREFVSYLLVHSPDLRTDDSLTFDEAYADFRLGILDSLKAASVSEESDQGRQLLWLIDGAYDRFKDQDTIPGCHMLQDAEEEFARLCAPRHSQMPLIKGESGAKTSKRWWQFWT